MTKERYDKIMFNNAELFRQEIKEGWHFCPDWDQLLIGPGMKEYEICTCKIKEQALVKLVLLESPYTGNIKKNIKYARACMRDCLNKGEAPFASHLLYTQPGILDDNIPEERKKGIEAGLLWGKCAEKTVVYYDYEITPGMQKGIERAKKEKRKIEFRKLYEK